MSDPELEEALRQWLQAGPDGAPGNVVDQALEETTIVRQGSGQLWRRPPRGGPSAAQSVFLGILGLATLVMLIVVAINFAAPSISPAASPGAGSPGQTLAADGSIAPPWSAATGQPDLAQPIVVVSDVHEVEEPAGRVTVFTLSITNWTDYGRRLFEQTRALPPCGEDAASARTWVDLRDASTNEYVSRYCQIRNPSRLAELTFSIAVDAPPPAAVYVELTDRATGLVARSTAVALPHPGAPTPAAGETPPVPPEPSGPVTTSEPSPLRPEGFAWRRRGSDPGLGEVGQLVSSAAANGRFVVIGMDMAFENWRVWTSGDGLRWQESTPPGAENDWLHEVAAGGPGFVLLASDGVVYLSGDGRAWEAVTDSDFEDRRLIRSGRAGDTLVGVGVDVAFENQALFVSSDGRDWQPAPTPEGMGTILDLVQNGDQLVALAVEAAPDSACARPLGLWQTSDGQSWTNLATLAESQGAECSSHGLLAIGERGWVVTADLEPGDLTSRSAAWKSLDGTTWEIAVNSPSDTTDVYAAPAGFIAVGHWYPAGCAIFEGDAWGQTWTSDDGGTWTLMPDEDWLHREVDLLRRLGRTLIGIGIDWTDSPNGAIWTADLDEVVLGGDTPAPEPEPSPDGGCG